MDIKLIGEYKTILITTDSEIDHHEAEKIRIAADRKIKSTNATNVIFDFSKLTFMDSAGIGVIMGRFKMTKLLGGKVILYGVGERIMRIIKMSRIDSIITICKNYDEAISRL